MQLHNNLSAQITTQVTDQEGRTVFTNLRPGSYTICEVLVASWFNITPNTLDATYHQPCYTVTVAPGQAVWTRFGNSTTPLVSAADETPVSDIVVCDLPATDDAGSEMAAERDPWEEEEQAGNAIFLPLVNR